jgi:hypothetical protein
MEGSPIKALLPVGENRSRGGSGVLKALIIVNGNADIIIHLEHHLFFNNGNDELEVLDSQLYEI